MAKRGTIGYQAELLRRKGQRRIERLEAVIKSENTSSRVVGWAKQQVREIKSAMQGTRQYSKSGKRYKSKTETYVKKQISRLESAIKEVAPRYTVSGDSFEVTQRELNRASVNAPSIYTKPQVQLFYRVTQKIWQRGSVGEHERNEAILNRYNAIRKQNGLTPLRLDQIVDYVLNKNETYLRILERGEKNKELTAEQREYYDNLASADTEDTEKPSPPDVPIKVIREITNALEDLFVLPDPLEIA